MSKPVKNLITEAYRKKFADVDGALVVDIRAVQSNQANKLRAGLNEKKIRVTVVKNALAKRAFKGTKLDGATALFEGPSALVTGGDSVVTIAREVLAQIKTIETVKVKGAWMDGVLFGADKIEALSKFPTRAEAQAQTVTLLLGPARKLAGQILGPGRKLGGIVKAIQEKKEKEGGATPAAA